MKKTVILLALLMLLALPALAQVTLAPAVPPYNPATKCLLIGQALYCEDRAQTVATDGNQGITMMLNTIDPSVEELPEGQRILYLKGNELSSKLYLYGLETAPLAIETEPATSDDFGIVLWGTSAAGTGITLCSFSHGRSCVKTYTVAGVVKTCSFTQTTDFTAWCK